MISISTKFLLCAIVIILLLNNVTAQIRSLPYRIDENLISRSMDKMNNSTSKYSITRNKLLKKNFEVLSELRPSYHLGSTYYDLQTNASTTEKIVYSKKNDKEYLQMIWMAETSPEGPLNGFPNRRTYYELFDISNQSEPTPLIGLPGSFEMLPSESTKRTGWPSIDKFSDGNVAILSHNLSNKPMNCNISLNIGSEFQALDVNSQSMNSAGWPHIAICGNDYIHSLQTYNSAFGGGVKSKILTYTKSKDYGQSFKVLDQDEILQNEISISSLDQMDSYSIDARENVVVLMFNFGIYEMFYMKSIDNGETFSEMKSLFSSPEQKLKEIGLIPNSESHYWITSDTFYIPGNSMDVIIDGNGKAHFVYSPKLVCKFGRRIINPSTGEFERILGYSDTIFAVNPSLGVDDLPNPNIFANQGMWYSMEDDTASNGLLNKYPCGIPSGDGWNGNHTFIQSELNNNLCTYPNFAIGDDNTLYVVYTSIKNDDGTSININRQLFPEPLPDTNVIALNNHLYMTHKKAGDFSWSTPINLTPDGLDCSFSTLCNDVVNDKLYFGYNSDSLPGCYVNSTLNVKPGVLDFEETKIMISWMNVNELNESKPGKGIPVSVQELPKANKDLAKGNSINVILSPNPVTNESTLNFQLRAMGVATIEVYSMTGEKVANVMNRFVTEGDHSVQFSTSSLPVGSYRISLKHNNTVSTVGMTIVR